MPLDRRTFLSGALGTGALVGLGACGGDGPSGAGSRSTDEPGSRASQGPVEGTLTFSFWGGSTGETAGFDYLKREFEAANPGATVELKVVPYDGFFAGIDRSLQAGNAPDVWRVDYTNIGKYSSRGALLDISPYYTEAEAEEFLPALWEAVQYDGRLYGVPHQTDTTAVVFDVDALAQVGVTTVPDRLEDAWTWEEFGDLATKLRGVLPEDQFPFAYAWTRAGAFRWLNWLYQAGGTLMNDDLTEAAIVSEAGTKALEFTKGFFDQQWVPASNTIKGARYSDEFFVAKTVPMAFLGDFLVPVLADPTSGYQGNWGATFMPQDEGAASDLGGNALVANADTPNADLAAAFLKFAASEDAMKYFCEQAIELPTRKTLLESELAYVTRPELVKVWATQAETVSETVVRETTVPNFDTINTLLQDQLEAAFSSGQDLDETLQRIADGVDSALAD